MPEAQTYLLMVTTMLCCLVLRYQVTECFEFLLAYRLPLGVTGSRSTNAQGYFLTETDCRRAFLRKLLIATIRLTRLRWVQFVAKSAHIQSNCQSSSKFGLRFRVALLMTRID